MGYPHGMEDDFRCPGSPHDIPVGIRVWETNRKGAFPLHMRVRYNNGEKTLTYFLHLRYVYYED